MIRYPLVFVITALWDLLWQQMVKGNIYVCFSTSPEILCPSQWKWIATGRKYFREAGSPLRAMFVAGLAAVYALIVMDFLDPYLPSILNLIFSSWVVGIPMRYAPDFIHTCLFGPLREHYYRELGFVFSSLTDIQSGIIVALTYVVLECVIQCKVGYSIVA